MTTPSLDPDRRLVEITAFDVLGRPERHDLAALADLAARICGVGYGAVTLMTDTEQHHVATSGLAPVVCAMEDSLCYQVGALETPAAVVIPDCRADPRVVANPFVNGDLAEVRFFASHRLVTRRGVVVGTLCVFDREPRELTELQVEDLRTLAERVVDVLELSLSTRELASSLVEVEAVRVELERSNDRLAAFAGQVSHDLKTPLTGMAISLALVREELAGLQDGSEVDADTLPLLDRAINGSTRMAALIDDMLAYAQVGGSLRLDDVVLDKVVQDVRSDLWDHLDGVALDIGPLPTVRGDEPQLRALLQNLLDNAAKFADPARPPRVVLRSRRSAVGWRIEVTDNGRGVPAEHLERIFEPMARADRSVAGTGIGLATCRRIVEAHGGRIGLEQAEPHGTTAWFELPG